VIKTARLRSRSVMSLLASDGGTVLEPMRTRDWMQAGSFRLCFKNWSLPGNHPANRQQKFGAKFVGDAPGS
jgi:hypothetical protein